MFRSDWGWKEPRTFSVYCPGSSQFVAQEVLSLLRGLASAVWHDYGGGPDFDRRLEEAAPRCLPTGQAINWFGLVGCDEGMIASN